MNHLRENGKINIDKGLEDGSIIINEEEQRGARTNKIWINNYEYMYKDVYPTTYEDFAEVIAYYLAKVLKIECAEYDFAVYKGNNGVITKNIVKDDKNIEMLSGNEIINRVYAEYIVPRINAVEKYQQFKQNTGVFNIYDFLKLPLHEKLVIKNELLKTACIINGLNYGGTNTNINYAEINDLFEYIDSFSDVYKYDFIDVKNGIIKSNNLYDVWFVVETFCKMNNYQCNVKDFMEKFVKMFIFDIITSQGDRHADNWSILIDSNTNIVELSPLYDNSGMCCLNREKAIANIVNYTKSIQDLTIHIKKREKIKKLLISTISHNNSGIKIDQNDVDVKNKNDIMIQKFVSSSSDYFVEQLIDMANKIDDNLLDEIYLNIEANKNIIIPEDVKIIVKSVLKENIKMINEIYFERREKIVC